MRTKQRYIEREREGEGKKSEQEMKENSIGKWNRYQEE